MATGVGLRIADDECIAAVVADTGEPDSDTPEPHFIVRESVLHMSDDGDAALGGAPPSGHSHSITGFFAAVGDPSGISVDDGPAYRAEDLVATALFCLINLAADHLAGPAEFYAAHPADWPAEQVSALRDALDYLGLRSVALVGEDELADGSDGRGYARHAANAALAAVLATPAGATPPDPSHTENALIVTDVLPALPTSEPTAQAYSEAMPVAYSTAAAAVTPAAEPATPTTVAPTPVPAPEPARARRTPLLIAAAAVLGLIFGGVIVALMLRDDEATPAPPLPNARSEPAPTSAAPPPAPVFVAPEPTIVEPEPVPDTEIPETTPPPPPATTAAPPPPPPSSTTTTPRRTPRTTPRRTPTTVVPYLPFPEWLPTPSMGYGIP
ncbi:hypothetical protein [Nocardia sp. BMG51109]|uniref:hypothetical protein n=1 Tax=Nocardia sp. BMG51109 TaxID=1056816 RepID=UPI0004673FE7|nr:hypothetical protein [Nocardia sp. BMG51109]